MADIEGGGDQTSFDGSVVGDALGVTGEEMISGEEEWPCDYRGAPFAAFLATELSLKLIAVAVFWIGGCHRYR